METEMKRMRARDNETEINRNIIIETKIILTTPLVMEKSIGEIFLTFLSLS